MTTIGDRIDKLLREKGMTYAETAKKLGVTKSAVGLWTANRNSISPKHIIQMFLLFPDMNLRWLLTGHGDMLFNEQPKQTHKDKIIEGLRYENRLLYRMIDHYEHRFQHPFPGQHERRENHSD